MNDLWISESLNQEEPQRDKATEVIPDRDEIEIASDRESKWERVREERGSERDQRGQEISKAVR